MISKDEQIFIDILDEAKDNEQLDLREIMKRLRLRCGSFSETEAILHMMEALIIESVEGRGW